MTRVFTFLIRLKIRRPVDQAYLEAMEAVAWLSGEKLIEASLVAQGEDSDYESLPQT